MNADWQNRTSGIGFGSSEYIVLRFGSSVDRDWLYYYLSRESFRTEVAERMSGAVGHKRVAKDFIVLSDFGSPASRTTPYSRST